MQDNQKPYFLLFNAITDALRDLARQNFGTAADRLMQAQRDAEDAYVQSMPEGGD